MHWWDKGKCIYKTEGMENQKYESGEIEEDATQSKRDV